MRQHFSDHGVKPFCLRPSIARGRTFQLTEDWNVVDCKNCLRQGWYFKFHNKWLPEYGNSCGKPTASKATILANYERLKQREAK